MSESDQKVRPPTSPPAPNLAEEIQEGVRKEGAAAETNDPLSVLAEQYLDKDKKLTETKQAKHKLQVARDRHKIRIPYIDRLFILTVVWLGIVIGFVFLQATTRNFFHLSDSVLIAFITSTTVSVIGLFLIVGKWLFPPSEDEEEKKE